MCANVRINDARWRTLRVQIDRSESSEDKQRKYTTRTQTHTQLTHKHTHTHSGTCKTNTWIKFTAISRLMKIDALFLQSALPGGKVSGLSQQLGNAMEEDGEEES